MPEELAIIGAGIWTAAHPEYGMLRWTMLPVCVVGVIIADCSLYAVGRYGGRRILELRWMRWAVPHDKRKRIEENFHRYGVGILLFGRLLPGVRLPLFLTAGIMKLPVPRFVLADSIGAILGNSILYFLAFWFGDSIWDLAQNVEKNFNRSIPILILVVIAGVGVYFLIHFWRKPVTEGDPKELPLIGSQIAARLSGDHKVADPPADPCENRPRVEDNPVGGLDHREGEEVKT